MKLLYINEHLSCFNYASGENSLIESIEIKKGDVADKRFKNNCIVFVVDGMPTFSYDSYAASFAKKGNIIICPANAKCKIFAATDSTLLIIQLNADLAFCDNFSFEALAEEKKKRRKKELNQTCLHMLEANKAISHFMDMLIMYLRDGLCCTYLFKMKIKEILFFLNAFYTKEEQKAFFAPILNDDFIFSLKVNRAYRDDASITVSQMADMINYSLSGFEKKFKKVFSLPVNKWLQNKKAQSVYRDINCTRKTFSELAYDHNFSSPAHFNFFCKKMFDEAPGNIRKKNMLG